jgi:shikimate kinase
MTPIAAVGLIGFMGAGKSHAGMLAAALLQVPFVDTDTVIAEQLGPIEEIFAQHGEAYFRSVERDVAVTVLEKQVCLPGVVSLGGGAVMDADVRQALGRLPHVVWLTAPPDVLFARASGGWRPLAGDEASFRLMLDQRLPLYRELATATVVNDGSRSIDEVAAQISALARVSA